jgi:hypothetical protein
VRLAEDRSGSFRRQPSSSSVNPTESDLVVRHAAVFDMAARLQHLEPANLGQRARRTADGVLDRVLDDFSEEPATWMTL